MSSLTGGVIAVGLLIIGLLLLTALVIYALVMCLRFRRTAEALVANTQEKVGFLRARAAALRVNIARRSPPRR